MDVTADDQLRAGVREHGERLVAATKGPLAGGSPGRGREVVVESDDAKRALGRTGKRSAGAGERVLGEGTALLAPGADGVEPDDEQSIRPESGLDLSEHHPPVVERAREACRRRVGDVVVPWDGENGEPDAVEKHARRLELLEPAAIREIARREDELGSELPCELDECVERLGGVALADVDVGEVENPRCHRRGRLYTRHVAEGSPEIFDDLYLGMRAGGAMRKQRRGEELTAEEEEALGHWQRLSMVRKTAAVGAFAVGTFGLGFTLGGLIFGRWRKA